MDQAFSRFVKAIFEEQTYPDLIKYPTLWQGIVAPQAFPDAYLPPYDMAGWTVPHQMGVKVRQADVPLDVATTRLENVTPPAGNVAGRAGYAYLISPQTNNSFIAVNRILEKRGRGSPCQGRLQHRRRRLSSRHLCGFVPKRFRVTHERTC